MIKFIARFQAEYPGIDATQYSCITWQQDGEVPDTTMARGMIAHNTAFYFFRLFDKNIEPDKIIVSIDLVEKFK